MTTSLSERATDAAAHVSRGRALGSHRRGIIVLTLGVVLLALAVAAISLGAYVIAPQQLLMTFLGQGEGGGEFVLFRLRLPRVVLGLLVGAGLGIAGGLFQSLLRNPLASPDIIGISGGASVAAAFGILVLGIGGAALSLLAFGGAVAVALVIFLLSSREGVSGYRFVLIGVGLAFMAQAVLGYLISRGDVRDVGQALVWMVGGLGGAAWGDILVLAIALAVLLGLVGVFAPSLRMLQLGDDTASGLGVPVSRGRPALILLAVAITAAATAFAGPVAFIAFVSAPIARRLVGGGGLALLPSALVGAIIVIAADLVGQHLVAGLQVPAGIITGMIGAPYLLWLLATTNREGRGA
jgi:iron complex transport system permease protein